MLVHFRKTGLHRYAVLVERELAPALVAHPAPGYDEYLPHDLLHFAAEAEWGLDGAVFGQLARGGDPGIFPPVERELVAPCVRRRKLRPKVRPKGRRSELLTFALECAWRARRRRQPLPDGWDDVLAAARVDRERLDRVVASLDELAERRHDLRIGEELTLEWPRPERRPVPAGRPHREKQAGGCGALDRHADPRLRADHDVTLAPWRPRPRQGGEMEIVVDDLTGSEIAEFLAEHIEEMRSITPPESKHALDLEGLRAPDITFWTVVEDGRVLACGALKLLGDGHGEIKSMRVAPDCRQRGVASTMLLHIIAEARRMGLSRLSLETGSFEFFEPARRLYRKHGFEICGPFAGYKPDPNSVFMTKIL